MSDVASLDLCRELYELSGWKFTEFNWWLLTNGPESGFSENPVAQFGIPRAHDGTKTVPAYDLGFLLQKLPDVTLFCRSDAPTKFWSCATRDRGEIADTPEGAAAKLAIELFKQGVLKREQP